MEYANLLQIHSECSLPLAVANIGKNLNAANKPALVLSPSSFTSTAQFFDLKERRFYGIESYASGAATVTYQTWNATQSKPAKGVNDQTGDANALATHLTNDGFVIIAP